MLKSSPRPPKSLRLDDLYNMVAHIYSEQNAHRPASATFAHFVEVCGMLTIHDRQKRREEVTVEDALCKALGWYFPLLAKFKVVSVEELLFRKFPYACPYCRLRPHVDSKCKQILGTKRTVDHEALLKRYEQNEPSRPVTLNDWQQMFQEIYPRSINGSARSCLGLLEELGEMAEAVRVYERYPKYFAGEAADVFSYLMGIANEHALRLQKEDRNFSFESEFLQRYPGLCVQCGYSVCVCPLVPESTVGRLAKELNLEHLPVLFSLDPAEMSARGVDIASIALNRAGGYQGIAQRFPFDRGDANKAVVIFCLRLAGALEPEHQDVAQRLRSAAITLGSSATYPGSRTRPEQVNEVVESIQAMLTDVSNDLLVEPAQGGLPSQIGHILSPKPYSVLLVFANPRGTTPLRLSEEDRAVREAVALSKLRDSISLDTLQAATTDDLRRALLPGGYRIVHISGHGAPGALLFEDTTGGKVHSPVAALRDLCDQHPEIECLILNACWGLSDVSDAFAPITIGMEASVDDQAAIEFVRGFYDGIAASKGFDYAVNEGKLAVKMKGLDVPIKVLKKATTAL